MFRKIILKRLLLLVPMFLGITLLSYALMRLAPGDPTAMLVSPKVSPAELLRIKENLGLNQPVIVQYFIWLKNLLCGNFGYSYINGRPVLTLIMERLPATLLLMFSSMVLTVLLTIPLGVVSAVKNRKVADVIITVLTFVGMSLPTFWLGLMIIMFFSLQLGWFPTSGMLDPLNASAGFWKQALDISSHIALPLLTMTIGSLAGLTKFMKNGMLGVLKQDYILAARARGISELVVVWQYGARNALLPVVTILGLSLPELVGGAFIIEYIFAWPGMGRLGVDAVFMRDFPVIMGILVISSLLIILGNLLADLSYSLVDPRVRLEKGK